jgi:hypothetical protein
VGLNEVLAGLHLVEVPARADLGGRVADVAGAAVPVLADVVDVRPSKGFHERPLPRFRDSLALRLSPEFLAHMPLDPVIDAPHSSKRSVG